MAKRRKRKGRRKDKPPSSSLEDIIKSKFPDFIDSIDEIEADSLDGGPLPESKVGDKAFPDLAGSGCVPFIPSAEFHHIIDKLKDIGAHFADTNAQTIKSMQQKIFDSIMSTSNEPLVFTAGTMGGWPSLPPVNLNSIVSTGRYFKARFADPHEADVPIRLLPSALRICWPEQAELAIRSRWVHLRGRFDRALSEVAWLCSTCNDPPCLGLGDDEPSPPLTRPSLVTIRRYHLQICDWLNLSIQLGMCEQCGTGYWA